MLLYLYHDLFFHVLYNSILIRISTFFLLLKWDTLACNSQICLMPLFFPQTDIIATLQFVDSCSFEKRELLAAPQCQGLMWVLPWWINLLWLKACRCFCCDSQHHKLGRAILFYILIFLEKFRDHCWRIVCKVWKTPKISRSISSSVTLKKQVSVWFGVYTNNKLMMTC